MNDLERTLHQAHIEQQHGVALAKVLEDLQNASSRMLARLDAHDVQMAALHKAFPGSDPSGHARYHEMMIEQLEERRKLRIAIQEKTISGLVWAAIVAIGLSIFHELKR